MAKKNFFKHWPTMLLGFIVAAILLVAVFSFQLSQTQVAVVTTFGRPRLVDKPGLHFRWPFPFQRVYTFDSRVRCFSGGEGKLEETMTRDGHNILVGIYVTFRISNAEVFFATLENMTKAEAQLNSLMRGAKNAAFGNYNFNQIVNIAPDRMRLDDIQKAILKSLREKAKPYGLEIISVGINTINVPKTISEKIFDRMIAERKKVSELIIAQGNKDAERIKIEANLERDEILADAQAEALEIRAAADAEAAKSYKVFADNPRLAEFLLKIDALREVMKGRTTLVVDTSTPPFDMLKSDTLDRMFRTTGGAPAAPAPAAPATPAK